MNEKQNLSFEVTVKSVNEEENSIEAVFSHKQKDRAGDVLPPDVLLDGAKNFFKNPVLLDSHNYSSVKNIIGRVEDLHIENGGLVGKSVYFVGKGNDAADWAFALAKEGLAAFSVGFRALEYDYIKEKDAMGNEMVTATCLKRWNCWKFRRRPCRVTPGRLKRFLPPKQLLRRHPCLCPKAAKGKKKPSPKRLKMPWPKLIKR